jgi:hypothetical protein
MAGALSRRRVRHGVYRPVRLEQPPRRGAIPGDEIMEAIDASYDTVVAKLPKKDRPAAPAE